MDKMRAKQEAIKSGNKGEKKDDVWFRPQAGDQDIRALPSEDGDPFKEFWIHYNLGTPFLCPRKQHNEKCAVCDYMFELYKEKTDESKKMAKPLQPRQRFATNVIERERDANGAAIPGSIKQGPKPYGYGKETYEQLIETALDPDYGDFTDLDQGRDFKLNYKLAETKGAFPKTKLTVRPKQTSVLKTKKEIKELLEKTKPVESFFIRKTPEEVRKILEEHMSSPFVDETTSNEDTTSSDEVGVTSIDQAIEELISK